MRGFKSLFSSLVVHIALIGLLMTYPPTKSFIFFKLSKTLSALEKTPQEKVLDEITIVKIAKKNTDELFDDEMTTVSAELDFLPSIELQELLSETLDLSFPIDQSSSFSLSSLENNPPSYQDYLSPLTASVPEELLSDQPPPTSPYEPTLSYKSPDVQQIDEFEFPSYVKTLPQMLDTLLYTYKDPSNQEYFKIELKLKNNDLFDNPPQEFLFVIDLSQKETRGQLALYKEAILKSIKQLKSTDRYNVIFLSKQLQTLFPEARSYKEAHNEPLEDLFTISHKTEAKPKQIARYLSQLLVKTEENPLHTHCLFFSQEPTQENQELAKLSRYAHSKLSFYPILLSKHAQEPATFKTLAQQLGGKLLLPPTHASFGRKFSSLMRDINQTCLRHVSIKLDSDKGPLELSIAESTKELTLNKPLKIFGKLGGAKTLHLQVVGSHGDDLFEMKKSLSIHEAKKGSSLIKEQAE